MAEKRSIPDLILLLKPQPEWKIWACLVAVKVLAWAALVELFEPVANRSPATRRNNLAIAAIDHQSTTTDHPI
ncbi:Hypothetical predicted protein [Olea europaea subsp. europaea]|uniref:Uncharacterized protein n=1 Tax=Olea europaea subsp. europaea TaxID=158383 RepID=A0A8S0PUF8_OLEEU|nr:Hypothetical predicted protein [Olea europaea subsp. europaea]